MQNENCTIKTQFDKGWINGGISSINSWSLMALATHSNWWINGLENIYIRCTSIDISYDSYGNVKGL